VWLRYLLERELVEAELPPQQLYLRRSRIADVEPQPVLAFGEQLAESVGTDLRRQAFLAGIHHKSHRSHGAPFS
jgi:hypothetical protein